MSNTISDFTSSSSVFISQDERTSNKIEAATGEALGRTVTRRSIVYNIKNNLSVIPFNDRSSYLNSHILVTDVRGIIDGLTVPYLRIKGILEDIESIGKVRVSITLDKGIKVHLVPLSNQEISTAGLKPGEKQVLFDEGAAFYVLRELDKQNTDETSKKVLDQLMLASGVDKVLKKITSEIFLHKVLSQTLYTLSMLHEYNLIDTVARQTDFENIEVLQEILSEANHLDWVSRVPNEDNYRMLYYLKNSCQTIKRIQNFLNTFKSRVSGENKKELPVSIGHVYKALKNIK